MNVRELTLAQKSEYFCVHAKNVYYELYVYELIITILVTDTVKTLNSVLSRSHQNVDRYSEVYVF